MTVTVTRKVGALVALFVGLGDAATGLLLVASPGLALRLFGLDALAVESEIFVRWIGVFVLAVGVAYLLPLAQREPERSARLRGAIAWTSVTRLLVSGFVAILVLSGALAERWFFVGAYDAVVAIAQMALLAQGAFGGDVRPATASGSGR